MLTISRLSIDDPLQGYQEGVGDPVANMGSAVVPNQRTPQQMAIPVATFGSSASTDTLAIRQRIKRQLRALLSNTPLKLLGGLYIAWDQDAEQNGWYVPDHMSISDGAEAALAHGFFKAEGQWNLVGRLRTHRRAAQFYIKDLRVSTSPRDYLKTLYSTDFASLSALAVLALPANITDAVNTATGGPFQVATGPFAMPRATRDGGTEYQVTNANADVLDYGAISYEQVEASRNVGDCVILDRRNNLGPFFAGGGGGTYFTTAQAMVPALAVAWRLNETAGTNIGDSSGNGNVGTYSGITLNQAGMLTSDTDKAVTVPNSGTMTANAYAPFPSSVVRTFMLLANRTATTDADTLFGLTGGSGGYSLQIAAAGTSVTLTNYSGTTVTWAAAWPGTGVNVHVALIHDVPNSTAELFINGVSQGVKSGINTGGVFGSQLMCGAATVGPSFNGKLDEMYVFNGALSAGQILDMAQRMTNTVPASYDTPAGVLDPQTSYGWEEVYGPDYPLSTGDVPILQNGRCRVRYSAGSGASGSPATSGPGFRVDVYNGSTWVEQGFFAPGSASLGNSADFTLTSAAVLEWTPDRAVLLVVATTGGLRVRMVITLQRGWSGPRVEVYNPTIAATSPNVTWYPISDTLNDFVAKNDGTSAQALGMAWSGAGTPSWPANQAILGAATMTGENWFSFVRAAQAFDMTIGVVQANVKLEHDTIGSNGIGYGSGARSFGVHATTGLYVQANLSFYATLTKQRQEAELMTLGTGTVSTADANASAGNAATTTRTTDANPHVSDAALGLTATTKYRVFIRVKVSASVGNFFVKTGTTTGATVTTASTAYVWVDCGEVVFSGTFEIHAWATAAATTSVDCYVAIKVEDRYNAGSNPVPLFDGARDQSQADLMDARLLQTVVARQ